MGDSESIMPTEISQTEKEMLYDITYVKSSKTNLKKQVKLTEAERRIFCKGHSLQKWNSDYSINDLITFYRKQFNPQEL